MGDRGKSKTADGECCVLCSNDILAEGIESIPCYITYSLHESLQTATSARSKCCHDDV